MQRCMQRFNQARGATVTRRAAAGGGCRGGGLVQDLAMAWAAVTGARPLGIGDPFYALVARTRPAPAPADPPPA